MRRNTIFGLALTIVMAAACQKNNDLELQGEGSKITFSATMEAPQTTKSTFEIEGNKAAFNWTSGDEILLIASSGDGYAKFTTHNTGAIASFTGEEDSYEQAYYPYESYNTEVPHDFKVTIPSVYDMGKYKEDTRAIMYSTVGEDNSLEFKHMGAVALFVVNNVPAGNLSFVFSAEKNFTGYFRPRYNYDGELSISNDRDEENYYKYNSGNSYTINFSSDTAIPTAKFYVPLPIGEIGTFVVQLKQGKNVIYRAESKDTEIVSQRAKLYVFKGLETKVYDPLAGANCYIVQHKTHSLKIETERVSTFWNESDPTKGGDNPENALNYEESFYWVPRVIWQEGSGSDAIITFHDQRGDLKEKFYGDESFYVRINSTNNRNVLIGITKQGSSEYLWSWHLWITDYLPGTTPAKTKSGQIHQYYGSAFQPGGIYENKYMMDRNLGATISDYNGYDAVDPTVDKGIVGLYYQFGRKDPFMNSTDPSVTSDQTTLAVAANNPDMLYAPAGKDWFYKDKIDLWNSVSNTKSIFDPCPKGWKVPIGGATASNNPWAGFGEDKMGSVKNGHNSFFIWSDTYKGRIYDDGTTKAYFPAAGNRKTGASAPEFEDFGKQGAYYVSSYEAVGPNILFFYSVSTFPNATLIRSASASIRCVQE